MRAAISDELLNAIDERIYLDLEIHILEKRMLQAEKDNKEGFAKHIDTLILKVGKQRREVNTYLLENGVKIFEPKNVNDVDGEDAIFVEYYYSVKVNGGYKEGTMRYWKAALRLKLKKRMSNYFGGA